MNMTADEIIAHLKLAPHPEGGHYRETFRDNAGDGRAVSTAIYFLLKRGERSHWHRVDAAEAWHFYAGAPLRLEIEDGKRRAITLGPDLAAGGKPPRVSATGRWSAAPWRRVLTLRDLSWPRRAGSRPEKEMAGTNPGHQRLILALKKDMDARDERGHDEPSKQR